MRTCISLFVIALIAACPTKPADGDFGEAKPVTDDGIVRKINVPPAAPDFGNAVALVSVFHKPTSQLTVTLHIKPGFHAYAPGEEVGKPVDLVVDAPWIVGGEVTIPAGSKKDLGNLGTSMILEGDVPLSVTVKDGTGDVKGNALVQVCTDKACDRPRKHAFAVPTT